MVYVTRPDVTRRQEAVLPKGVPMTVNTVEPKVKWVALSVPNCLTYGRILVVPIMAACFFLLEGNTANWIAVGLFVVAAVTDFFDGYLARIW